MVFVVFGIAVVIIILVNVYHRGETRRRRAAEDHVASQAVPFTPLAHGSSRTSYATTASTMIEDHDDEEEAGDGWHQREEDDDTRYALFVAEKWSREGISLVGMVLHRIDRDGELVRSDLHSLVVDEVARLYVNTVEDGRRITLAGDSRHKWFRGEERVDETAWLAIFRGHKPSDVLRRAPYAASALEAMSPAFNRASGRGRRFVILYLNAQGDESWRMVSHVVRQADRFSAVCHFRYGERRSFLNSGLLEVVDPETGEALPLARFLAKAR